MRGRAWEKCWPILFAVASGIAALCFTAEQQAAIMDELTSQLITVQAVLVGFLSAALTLVLSSQGLRTIERLKNTRAYKDYLRYHWEAVWLGLLSIFSSMVVLVVDKHPKAFPLIGAGSTHLLFILWTAMSAWATFSFIRAVYLLRCLLAD